MKNPRIEEHVRATGWLIFIASWIVDPVFMTRWIVKGEVSE